MSHIFSKFQYNLESVQVKLVINGNRVAFFLGGGRGVGGGCKDFNKLVHMMIYIVLPPKRTDITNTDCSKLYLKIIHKLFFKEFFFFRRCR